VTELEKQSVLNSIERVGGTSSGGITAALLAIGYTPDELREIIVNTPIQII
jgi:NTE family protein